MTMKGMAPEDILRMRQESGCPHIRRKRSGDESWDFCELSDRPSGMKACLLMSGDKCETWEEIQKEWQNEGTHNNK